MSDAFLDIFQDFTKTMDQSEGWNLESVLDFVLAKTRRLTFAEAGTVFICEPMLTGQQNALVCSVVQNDEIAIEQRTFTVPVDSFSIAGFTVLEKQLVKIDDVYEISSSKPYKFNPSFDRKNNYRTVSMLSVPLITVEGRVIGVMQLVNHIAPAGSETPYAPFREEDVLYMENLSSVIGMIVERTALKEEISRLRAAQAPMRANS